MTIGGNYPAPVLVNGYECRNCTDVDNAKKGIDPAHPKSGPYGIDASTDPSRTFDPAVTFGGALSGLNASPSASGPGGSPPAASPSTLDISI
jgi:hypothetical protein